MFALEIRTHRLRRAASAPLRTEVAVRLERIARVHLPGACAAAIDGYVAGEHAIGGVAVHLELDFDALSDEDIARSWAHRIRAALPLASGAPSAGRTDARRGAEGVVGASEDAALRRGSGGEKSGLGPFPGTSATDAPGPGGQAPALQGSETGALAGAREQLRLLAALRQEARAAEPGVLEDPALSPAFRALVDRLWRALVREAMGEATGAQMRRTGPGESGERGVQALVKRGKRVRDLEVWLRRALAGRRPGGVDPDALRSQGSNSPSPVQMVLEHLLRHPALAGEERARLEELFAGTLGEEAYASAEVLPRGAVPRPDRPLEPFERRALERWLTLRRGRRSPGPASNREGARAAQVARRVAVREPLAQQLERLASSPSIDARTRVAVRALQWGELDEVGFVEVLAAPHGPLPVAPAEVQPPGEFVSADPGRERIVSVLDVLELEATVGASDAPSLGSTLDASVRAQLERLLVALLYGWLERAPGQRADRGAVEAATTDAGPWRVAHALVARLWAEVLGSWLRQAQDDPVEQGQGPGLRSLILPGDSRGGVPRVPRVSVQAQVRALRALEQRLAGTIGAGFASPASGRGGPLRPDAREHGVWARPVGAVHAETLTRLAQGTCPLLAPLLATLQGAGSRAVVRERVDPASERPSLPVPSSPAANWLSRFLADPSLPSSERAGLIDVSVGRIDAWEYVARAEARASSKGAGAPVPPKEMPDGGHPDLVERSVLDLLGRGADGTADAGSVRNSDGADVDTEEQRIAVRLFLGGHLGPSAFLDPMRRQRAVQAQRLEGADRGPETHSLPDRGPLDRAGQDPGPAGRGGTGAPAQRSASEGETAAPIALAEHGWLHSGAGGLALLIGMLPAACRDLAEGLDVDPEDEVRTAWLRAALLAALADPEAPEPWLADALVCVLAGLEGEAEDGVVLGLEYLWQDAVHGVALDLLRSLGDGIPGMKTHAVDAIRHFFIRRPGGVRSLGLGRWEVQMARGDLDMLLERSNVPLGTLHLPWVGVLEVSLKSGSPGAPRAR